MQEKKEKVKVEDARKFPSNNVRISITSGDWPHHLFKEWEDDCKRNYNNIRWIKMYKDHKQAILLETVMGLFTSLKTELEEMRERVFFLEKLKTEEEKEEEPEESVPTIGGKATSRGD